MNKTSENDRKHSDKFLVTTRHLQELLDCGKESAMEIGIRAEARFMIGRKLYWKVENIKEYIKNN